MKSSFLILFFAAIFQYPPILNVVQLEHRYRLEFVLVDTVHESLMYDEKLVCYKLEMHKVSTADGGKEDDELEWKVSRFVHPVESRTREQSCSGCRLQQTSV